MEEYPFAVKGSSSRVLVPDRVGILTHCSWSGRPFFEVCLALQGQGRTKEPP